MFGFLFWLFLAGIIVASLQDLKRREIDNWLNLFLLISSFVFIFYKAVFEKDVGIVFHAAFALLFMFIFMNLFYYGRVFAGGDAKLLVAMTVFFVGGSFYLTLFNIGLFLLLLMISGSVYGLIYSFVLYVVYFKEVNKEILEKFSMNWNWILFFVFLGVLFFILGFFNFLFLIGFGLLSLLPLLYIFTKGLENVSMVKTVSGKDLREGFLLAEDVKIGNKIIRVDWDGLSLQDIKLLKNKKKIKIKSGLPFAPVFLIAFVLYVFFKDYLLSFMVF